jgi:tRNA threonylcarbamoyladenosine biosynthesis protein TsaE
MKTTQIISRSPDDLPAVAKTLLEKYPEKRVFAFYGSMGAGKTTFIRELCQQLNVADNVASPTFSIINEYKTTAGDSIFHFDFYRLTNASDALAIGSEEYFYSGDYCLIEWPEIVKFLLPENTVTVNIEADAIGEERVFTF